ncbi:MAG: hypothetical protein K1X28_10310 [Parachlamydiales bacterium]|nr:hypothetical protein [Parachlamydiales bacterium]
MRYILLLILHITLLATDYDCIVVGSSPFSLFEALYQYHSGNRVMILEEAAECGGAWKGINVCGIMHADLGCHQIGHDTTLKAFLEKYAGCKIVSMDHPNQAFDSTKSPNGWYFSRGCYELIENLLKLISATDITLLNNTRADNVSIDANQKIATIQTKNGSYTTKKVIVTPMVSINVQPANQPQNYGKSKHYHLYMLIQDPTTPRFSYHGGVVSGASRMMNLSHFVGLVGTGRQLIVVQTYNEQYLSSAQTFLDGLKKSNLVDKGAYILETQSYIYESGAFHQGLIHNMGGQGIVEVLQTGHFQSLSTYIPKWQMVLKPYQDALRTP